MSEEACEICEKPLTETERKWGVCDDCEAKFEEELADRRHDAER